MKVRVAAVIAFALFGTQAARAADDFTVGMDGRHVAGETKLEGFDVHGGWRNFEIGYQDLHGQDSSLNGPTFDAYLPWHTYFVTAGVDYLSGKSASVSRSSVDWRIGGGVQFLWLRAGLRYEAVPHNSGLGITVGLNVPVF